MSMGTRFPSEGGACHQIQQVWWLPVPVFLLFHRAMEKVDVPVWRVEPGTTLHTMTLGFRV